jgi:hypothetical protein
VILNSQLQLQIVWQTVPVPVVKESSVTEPELYRNAASALNVIFSFDSYKKSQHCIGNGFLTF